MNKPYKKGDRLKGTLENPIAVTCKNGICFLRDAEVIIDMEPFENPEVCLGEDIPLYRAALIVEGYCANEKLVGAKVMCDLIPDWWEEVG